ncbi:SUPPRESSOR OF GAMMA RESPONSE 1-like [Cucurbita moschata]|uniref:SUPPRESSOR OF GAMMA RESPONSE 1-like n=1 Tax=Cucurbita moschata TaxID=3662 RepID=A0A6J1GZ57_CUCMO|nr:SUPPRESSOR OF GAMMA RESPONSE 1-like [Cucurbita moschata]
MARPSWLVDSNRIATKIKSASGTNNPRSVEWESNPSRSCPNCLHTIDNSDVAHEWPGLPRGVKFDPSDQEIIWHLLAKVGIGGSRPHPFIDEFIPTVVEDDGICYTHPQKLPGVKQDGSVSHFFHRAIKAYNTGTRKRRKITDDDFGDVRWHKTGRTKPVVIDGVQKGCKKIMVLYMSFAKGGRAEKTNWVMHQYHLGTEEDERDGEYVISKIFYQQQNVKQGEVIEQEVPEIIDAIKVDPRTPKSATPEPPRVESRCVNVDPEQDSVITSTRDLAEVQPEFEKDKCDMNKPEGCSEEVIDDDENRIEEEPKWWEGESQNILDSQQLVEALSLCDDIFQSQSPPRDGNANNHGASGSKSCFSEYAKLGADDLRKDIEECQNLVLDPANIELDTPPEFRLSQLDFGSQESFLAWGGKAADE